MSTLEVKIRSQNIGEGLSLGDQLAQIEPVGGDVSCIANRYPISVIMFVRLLRELLPSSADHHVGHSSHLNSPASPAIHTKAFQPMLY